jgi:type IV pilus assembly protein PilX
MNGSRRRSPAFAQGRASQRGVVLFIALIFLIVLTLLGVSLFGVSSDEEKMARNFRDTELAYEATEAALHDAEIRVSGFYAYANSPVGVGPATPVVPTAFNSSCTGGLCSHADSTQPVESNYGLMSMASPSVTLGDCPGAGGCNGAGTGTTTGSPAVSGVAQQPRYLVEILPWTPPGEDANNPDKSAYLITARGVGRSQNTQVVLQEIWLWPRN